MTKIITREFRGVSPAGASERRKFFVVVLAKDLERARGYRTLPGANDIHTMISEHNKHTLCTKENDERK